MTDELKQDVYPAATLEGTYGSGTAAVDVEKNYYTINSGDIVASSTATGISTYQNNNGNPPYNNNPNGSPAANSAKLYKLNATASKTGLGITLKVMSGDKIDIFGKSYYFQNNAGDGSGYNLAALDILTALIGSPQGGTTAVHGPVTASDLNGISGTPVGTFLSGGGRTPTNTSTPRAYINYIILDEQFMYVSGGFSAVGTNSTVKDHHSELQDIAINKNGYIFIYCSNESPVNVFFDNLQVVHTRGPLLEETHYYPFGLTMAGISSKALNFGGAENKKKFTGQMFDDDLGWNTYQMKFRTMDPQIGRFLQIDPLASKYVHNSTYTYAENDVIRAIDIEGLEKYIVTMRTFIPPAKVSNPNPFSSNKTFAGDNRTQYQANATSYRTEQSVKADFDNKSMSLRNNTASGTTGYDKTGKVNETSTPSSAGTVKGNVDAFENAVGKPSAAIINFDTHASNKLVEGSPAIDANMSITIAPQQDGSFNYSVTGAADGYPAYELWVTDDKGNSVLVFGQNPVESGEGPGSLFPPMEHTYDYKGNSKDATKGPVVNFSDAKNKKEDDDKK